MKTAPVAQETYCAVGLNFSKPHRNLMKKKPLPSQHRQLKPRQSANVCRGPSSSPHCKRAAERSLLCHLPVTLIGSSCDRQHRWFQELLISTSLLWPTFKLLRSNRGTLFWQLNTVYSNWDFRTLAPRQEKLTRWPQFCFVFFLPLSHFSDSFVLFQSRFLED